MDDKPKQEARYEFIGPNADGLIRLQMPNADPAHGGEFFCITLGSDRDAIAQAMRRWLGSID